MISIEGGEMPRKRMGSSGIATLQASGGKIVRMKESIMVTVYAPAHSKHSSQEHTAGHLRPDPAE
jgi:hypothetical protein